MRQHWQWLVWCVLGTLLAGCAGPQVSARRAPIMEYRADKAPVAPTPAAADHPVMDSVYETVTRIHIVQKGDTLYSIAFMNGVDYRDVADWNNIDNPAAINIGQQLQLHIPVSGKLSASANAPKSVMDSSVTEKQVLTKSYPKVGKLVYSSRALAQAERLGGGISSSAPVATTTVQPKVNVAREREAESEDPLEWSMPTSGRVIASYSEEDNRKGVDIAGQQGQAILASASGKVVYSGSGLRGYGKLVIIKHNKTYLSAYAHNERILVKEGQNVNKGQKIAEMGNTDADQVKLHFEIRKMGKPVDPAKYLPQVKS